MLHTLSKHFGRVETSPAPGCSWNMAATGFPHRQALSCWRCSPQMCSVLPLPCSNSWCPHLPGNQLGCMLDAQPDAAALPYQTPRLIERACGIAPGGHLSGVWPLL